MPQGALAFDSINLELNAELRSLDVAQWKYLVSHIDEPATAKIIVEYLDDDPMVKVRVSAIYMRARDTVQRSCANYVSAGKWGETIVRSVSRILRPAKRRLATNEAKFSNAEALPGECLVWPELRPELLSA